MGKNNKSIILWVALAICTTVAYQNCAPFEGVDFNSYGSFFQGYETSVDNNPFVCEPNVEPPPNKLRRLTKKEYTNTLADLFRGSLSVAEINSSATQIPEEEINSEFKNFSNIPSLSHVEGYIDSAEKIADLLTSTQSKLDQALGTNCVDLNAPLSAACMNQLADNYFMRSFRRPITLDEKNKIQSIYTEIGDHLLGVKAIIQYSIVTPDFLYRLETEGKPIGASQQVTVLTPYELASRLSYFLIKSMPDDELFSAAANRELATKEQILGQTRRLVSSSQKSKAMVQDFFNQWLKVQDKTLNYSTAESGNININNSFVTAATNEFNSFIENTIWQDGGVFSDLMLSRKAYFNSSELAKVYGVSGQGNAAVLLPEGQRLGLLTRVRFLMTGQDSTRPMQRGSSFQRNILCNDLQQPPPFPNDPGALMPPEFDPELTTRERFEAKTNGSRCLGCHTSINPPAFAFEQFDSLGRFRATENIFDGTGTLLNSHPVDGTGQLALSRNTSLSFNDSLDLIHQSVAEPNVSACFVSKWVSYAFARPSDDRDNCSKAQMYDTANTPDQGVLQMIEEIVGMDSFRVRKISDEGTP